MRNKKNYHKRKLRRGRILLFLAAVLLIFCLLLKVPALFSESIGEDTFRTFSLYRTKEIASDDIHKGELILVNASWSYSFPSKDETVPIASQKNDSWRVKDDVIRLLPVTIRQMNRMFSACERKTGIDNISVISAYRDYAYQDGLFNDRVNSDGYYEAIRWVAVPGYSEHHTGYAADLAVAVHVRGNDARGFETNRAAEHHLFAELDEQLLEIVVFELLRLLRDVAVAGSSGKHAGRGLLDIVEELLIAGNEVGFTEDLDHDSLVSVDRGIDFAFLCRLVRTLFRFRGACFTQILDGGFHIAVGFRQRFFAIHHPRVGFIAQLLDHCSGNIRHCRIPFRLN